MARTKGSMGYANLARMSDIDALRELLKTREPSYALNTLKKIRRTFWEDGIPRDEELPKGEEKISTEAYALLHYQPPTEEQLQTSPINPPMDKPNTSTPSNAAGEALAQMVAPYLLNSLRDELKDYISRAPKELVVLSQGEERKIEGTAHEAAPKVLKLVSAGLNVMMVGPAGCGKTLLAKTVGEALERPVTIISCSAGMSESQLLGRLLPLGENGSFRYVESPFITAYQQPGVILLDEIDAADPNLLLVINAALANGGVEIESRKASGLDTKVARHANCIIMAAANTWGHGADLQYMGRGALDASTLDRFYRLEIGYDGALERQLARAEIVALVSQLRLCIRSNKIKRVVSTRMITRLERALSAGITLKEAFADETASWSADEKARIGSISV